MKNLLTAALFIFIVGILLSCNKKCDDPRIEDGCIDQSGRNREIICTSIYDPVCGCDGKTYGNPCEASRAGVLKITPGECGKTETK